MGRTGAPTETAAFRVSAGVKFFRLAVLSLSCSLEVHINFEKGEQSPGSGITFRVFNGFFINMTTATQEIRVEDPWLGRFCVSADIQLLHQSIPPPPQYGKIGLKDQRIPD